MRKMDRIERPSIDFLFFQKLMSGTQQTKLKKNNTMRPRAVENERKLNTILEGQEVKDAVKQGNSEGEAEEKGIGVPQHPLKLVRVGIIQAIFGLGLKGLV